MASDRRDVFVLVTIASLLLMSHSPLLHESTSGFYETPDTKSVDSEDIELPPNGDYEEILVEFGDVSIGDLYGLYITLHDAYGESYEFWFDTSGSDYYDPDNGRQIPVYAADNISVVATALSDIIGSLGNFESWTSENSVFIRSLVKGDLSDSSTNADSGQLTVSVLKQGLDIRIHAMMEDVAVFDGDVAWIQNFAGLKDGSFLLSGLLYNFSANILGCSTGPAEDTRDIFIMKVDSEGTCSWLRKINGYQAHQGGGIGGIHPVDGGAIIYIVSRTIDNSGNEINGAVATEILGQSFPNIDLFAMISDDGVWQWVEPCPLGSEVTYNEFLCHDYFFVENSGVFIAGEITHHYLSPVRKISLQGDTSRFGSVGWSYDPGPGYALPKILSLTGDNDGHVYALTDYTHMYSDGDVTWAGGEERYHLGKYHDSHTSVALWENSLGTGIFGSPTQEVGGNSFMLTNETLVIEYFSRNPDYNNVQHAHIAVINTSSGSSGLGSPSAPSTLEMYSTGPSGLPGINRDANADGKYTRFVPGGGSGEFCFVYGPYDAVQAAYTDFSISCYNENLELLWDYAKNIGGIGDPSWDFSGPGSAILGLDCSEECSYGISSYAHNNQILSRIVPPHRLDYDSDSILDLVDSCLGTGANETVDEYGCSWRQRDADGDLWSNGAESDCGTDFESSASIPDDFDGDFECDLIDDDDDNDGAKDEVDLFPYDELDWSDFDGDGIGDNADTDDDNDGWSDVDELRCLTDHLDSSKKPVDNDGDGECDEVNPGAVGGGWSSQSATSHCEFQGIGIYSDAQGCPVVFSTTKPDSKTRSNIVSVSTVPRGSNGVSEMVLSNDGNVLAILDPYQNLRIEFLNEPSSSYSMIISENDHLLLHPVTGRVSIADDDSCLDVLTDLPCGEGWSEENQFASTRPHWTGSVYFSHEYTACKPGWTGWAHCGSGWYEVGEWNEFASPSIQGLVSDMGGSEYCPGCSSPDGRYLADVVDIATDWELLGYIDARMDVIVSTTETWTSSSGIYEKPGGVATIIGGHLVDYCNSIVCLISEMSSADDGMLYGFGGFTWSGDSGYLYAATSDSIITIDPDGKNSFEENNPYECGTTGDLLQLVGVSTPDGSTVVIPCGDNLLILTIDRSPSSGAGMASILVIGLIIAAFAVYWRRPLYSEGGVGGSTALLLVLVMVAPVLSGCLGGTALDTDPISLPETIEISLQGGVVDDNPILYIDVEGKVPPETIDVLVVTEDTHSWVSVTNIRYTTQFGLGGICQDSCDVSVTAFYMGKSVNTEIIHFA